MFIAAAVHSHEYGSDAYLFYVDGKGLEISSPDLAKVLEIDLEENESLVWAPVENAVLLNVERIPVIPGNIN